MRGSNAIYDCMGKLDSYDEDTVRVDRHIGDAVRHSAEANNRLGFIRPTENP